MCPYEEPHHDICKTLQNPKRHSVILQLKLRTSTAHFLSPQTSWWDLNAILDGCPVESDTLTEAPFASICNPTSIFMFTKDRICKTPTNKENDICSLTQIFLSVLLKVVHINSLSINGVKIVLLFNLNLLVAFSTLHVCIVRV